MASSTGPVLIAGGLAIANESVLGPLASGKPENWTAAFRLIPVTAGLALALGLLERVVPEFATGLAWLLVAGVLIFPVSGQPPVLSSASKVLKLS